MRLTELWFTERMNPNEEARDEWSANESAAHDAPTTRRPVSLAPGFSRVRWRGKMVQPLQRFPAPGKPLKRFASQISAARARKPQPQRGCVLQPRVARAERATLGGREQIAFNPNGVAAQCATVTNDRTPLGLRLVCRPEPRVARSSQPWAGGRSPVGAGARADFFSGRFDTHRTPRALHSSHRN